MLFSDAGGKTEVREMERGQNGKRWWWGGSLFPWSNMGKRLGGGMTTLKGLEPAERTRIGARRLTEGDRWGVTQKAPSVAAGVTHLNNTSFARCPGKHAPETFHAGQHCARRASQGVFPSCTSRASQGLSRARTENALFFGSKGRSPRNEKGLRRKPG